jgi:hypothetical protein
VLSDNAWKESTHEGDMQQVLLMNIPSSINVRVYATGDATFLNSMEQKGVPSKMENFSAKFYESFNALCTAVNIWSTSEIIEHGPDDGKVILTINQDGTITLPGGGKSKVIGNKLVEPIYRNQFIRKSQGTQEKGGTFESTPRGVRANSIVQCHVIIPSGMVGMKNCRDEATVILKDNHGDGSKHRENQ